MIRRVKRLRSKTIVASRGSIAKQAENVDAEGWSGQRDLESHLKIQINGALRTALRIPTMGSDAK